MVNAGNSKKAVRKGMRAFLRDNGLSIVIAALFLLFMAGQTWSGLYQYNEEQSETGSE